MKKIRLFELRDGAPRKGDQLPRTRRESYFDVLKLQFSKLVGLSLLISVFFIPFITFYILKTLYFINLPVIGNELTTTYRTLIFTSITNLIYLPLLVIGFVGLGMGFVFTKDLLFQKPNVSLKNDFITNIKLNLNESIIAAVVFWAGLLVLNVNFAFYPLISNMPFIIYSFAFIVIIGFIITTIYALFILVSGTLYKNTIKSSLQNNLILTLVLFPKNILIALISVLPLLVFFLIPYVLVQLISGGVILFLGMAHVCLSFTAYALGVFDKYINDKYAQDLVKEGLGHKEAHHGNTTL